MQKISDRQFEEQSLAQLEQTLAQMRAKTVTMCDELKLQLSQIEMVRLEHQVLCKKLEQVKL